jgi:hypothetical protein
VQSVLDQSFQDFEIVVTDDGSTDDTVSVIRSFDDPRIRLEIFRKNRGAAVAISECGRRCRGEYVANLCSDDVWESEKLEKQVAFLDAHPDMDAVLTRVLLIDEDGSPLDTSYEGYRNVFDCENLSRLEWLGRFFREGNCLCMPSAMIRRSVYEALDFQDRRFASLSDFDFWVRFSFDHEFHIMDERLTRFRVRSGMRNASSDRPENRIRSLFETRQILEHYLRIDRVETLLAVLPESAAFGAPTPETLPYFLARVALEIRQDSHRIWGLDVLFRWMGDPLHAAEAELRFGFTTRDLHDLTKTVDASHLVERDSMTRRIDALTAELVAHQDLLAEAKLLRSRVVDLANESEERLQLLDRIRHTSSWRITAPLRSLKSFLLRRKLNGDHRDGRR